MRRIAAAALALLALSPGSRADTVTLASLLAGGSIASGGYVFSDFRNYEAPPPFLGIITAPATPASAIGVTASGAGVTFSDPAITAGQVLVGEQFDFTVTRTTGIPIGSLAVTATATLGQASFPNFDIPTASAGGLTFTNPYTDRTYNATRTADDVFGASVDSLDVHASFSAIGTTIMGNNTLAEINSATITVGAIPEPGPLALAGTAAAVAAVLARWRRRAW